MRTVHVTSANLVTGSRFVLTAGVAAVAGADGPRWALAALIIVALLTDLVDGRLARRTGTESAFGARLDMEADALLILVLSAVAATRLGWWVLALGLVRYVFAVVVALVPRLQAPPPPRFWCKVVAAVTGVALAVAAVDVVPRGLMRLLLIVVALLLAESFGHEAVDRWRAGGRDSGGDGGREAVATSEEPARRPRSRVVTVLALALVWFALVVPTTYADLSWRALVRLPLELLLVAVLALLPWRRVRSGVAVLLGLLLAVLLVVKVLDIGFNEVFERTFDPVGDWAYLGPGVGVLGDSIGTTAAHVAVFLVILLALALLVLLPLAVRRLVRVAADRPRRWMPVATAFGLAWLLLLATGVDALPGTALASHNVSVLALDEVQAFRADLADQKEFAREIGQDPYADTPPDSLFSALQGKDVMLVFVESYGRVAVQGTSFSPGVDQVLRQGNQQLAAAGYHERSAFMTSPTFGAGSWLAHSTFESGLWVDSERRYRQLIGAQRLTLTSAFGAAGWHTVFDVPADTQDWSQGRDFYHFQTYYDGNNVGYHGPAFAYSPMPDQYVLSQLERTELAPTDRPPVWAEVDLTSSHHPWTPYPHLVRWRDVGDGSVFDPQPAQGQSADQVFSNPDAVKSAYGATIQYTMKTLTSFLTTYKDPNLVMIVLGDHQPHSYVSGQAPGHDVPVSVIAQDPKVMQAISSWGWQDGLLPTPDAPVWRMDQFRDRFIAAFS